MWDWIRLIVSKSLTKTSLWYLTLNAFLKMKRLTVYSPLRVLTSIGTYPHWINKKNFTTLSSSIPVILFSKFNQLKAVSNYKITSYFPQIRFSFTELGLLIQKVPDQSTPKVLFASTPFSYIWLTNVILIKARIVLIKCAWFSYSTRVLIRNCWLTGHSCL